MKCPFCAEEIQDEAKKCRYCGEWIPEVKSSEPPQPPASEIRISRPPGTEAPLPLRGGLALPLVPGPDDLKPRPGTTAAASDVADAAARKRFMSLVAWVVVIGACAWMWNDTYSGPPVRTYAELVNGWPKTGASPSPLAFLEPTKRTVSYKVTGSASAASLTYQNPQNGTVQSKVSLPWSTDMTFKDGDYVYISAQNEGDSGTVTTTILIDGKPWKTTTSDGGYTIADCNGSVAAPP